MSQTFQNGDIDPAYYSPDLYVPRSGARQAMAAHGSQKFSATKAPHETPTAGQPAPAIDDHIETGIGGHEPTPILAASAPDHSAGPCPPPSASRLPSRRGRLKHVDRFIDHNGTPRQYYRRGRGARTALPGTPGSSEFDAAYASAQQASRTEFLRTIRQRSETDTFGLLVRRYLSSHHLDQVNDATHRSHERVLNAWLVSDRMAARSVAALRPHHVRAMMANRAVTPAAANDLLKKLSHLMRFAVEHRWRPDDPTRNIAPFARSGPRRLWTAAELSAFAARWPASTTAGTAFVLLLATGLRPQNIVRLKGADLIRMDGVFGNTLTHCIRPEAFMVMTCRGAPFSAHGFVNFFSAAVRAANLPPDCVAGGLRKSRSILESLNLAPQNCVRRHAAEIEFPNTELLIHEPT